MTETASKWSGLVAPAAIAIVGAEWDGELLDEDTLDELLELKKTDDSVDHLLLRLEETWEELPDGDYAHREVADRVNVMKDDEEHEIDVIYCVHCGQYDCNLQQCIEAAFNDAALREEMLVGRKFAEHGSTGPEVVNDTFLALVQGKIARNDFDARVKKQHEELRPTVPYVRSAYAIDFDLNGQPGERAGTFSVQEAYIDAVAAALNDVAVHLDAGDIKVD